MSAKAETVQDEQIEKIIENRDESVRGGAGAGAVRDGAGAVPNDVIRVEADGPDAVPDGAGAVKIVDNRDKAVDAGLDGAGAVHDGAGAVHGEAGALRDETGAVHGLAVVVHGGDGAVQFPDNAADQIGQFIRSVLNKINARSAAGVLSVPAKEVKKMLAKRGADYPFPPDVHQDEFLDFFTKNMEFHEEMKDWKELAAHFEGHDAGQIRHSISQVICIAEDVGLLLPQNTDDMEAHAMITPGWLNYLKYLSFLVYEKLALVDETGD